MSEELCIRQAIGYPEDKMTLRDEFACAALKALAERPFYINAASPYNEDYSEENCKARAAYKWADAMLKARQQ